MDEWLKDVVPSSELRKWHGHVPERFEEFRHCRIAELGDPLPSIGFVD